MGFADQHRLQYSPLCTLEIPIFEFYTFWWFLDRMNNLLENVIHVLAYCILQRIQSLTHQYESVSFKHFILNMRCNKVKGKCFSSFFVIHFKPFNFGNILLQRIFNLKTWIYLESNDKLKIEHQEMPLNKENLSRYKNVDCHLWTLLLKMLLARLSYWDFASQNWNNKRTKAFLCFFKFNLLHAFSRNP